MLGAYRVLDLTDERGQLAGLILAALGAEVIAVEAPGGTPSRRIGPYAEDCEHPDRSLFHWAFNRGKQSVVLDLADPAGRAALAELAAGADVLLDCGAPGLDPAELAALAAANPALVHVSITAFGLDGPKAAWPASDLTVNAASGQLVLTGDSDRAPLRISAPPQAFLQAAADAAGAALLALTERRRSGLGQRVEVAAQTSMMASAQSYVLASLVGATPLTRSGGGVQNGPLTIQLVWACADGHVSLTLLFGDSLGPFARRLFEWIHEEGMCEAADRDKDWINLGMQLSTGEEPVSEWDRLRGVVARFLATKTKAELLAAALDRKLLFAPLSTPAELAGLEQLRQRGYWDEVPVERDGAVRSVRFPGPFCRFSRTQPEPLGAPPRLGAHTAAVLAAPARRPAAAPAPPRAEAQSGGPDRALTGLKVLDFMWAVAGPSFTRALADHGATVVKLESQSRTDGARTVGPFLGDDPGPENTALWHNMGAGKLGLALDLRKPEAHAVVLDLVRWADVVTESFSPRAMRAMGLGYETLAEVNPGLIMVSSCLMGQSGPMAQYAGFGTMAAAICGFHHLTGWPDRPPVGPFSAYTDYVAPRFTLAAFLAALDERERTGMGQHLDFSQLEASLHLLGPALLDWTVNGREAQRAGNDDPRFAPHGVYRCAGPDEWAAIACETDEQHRALCAVIGAAEPAEPAGLAGLAGLAAAERVARRRELDAVIEAWTAARPAAEVEAALVAAGVPAHRVQDSALCVEDPQLVHRGHFVRVPHPLHGETWLENSRLHLHRTPARVERPGPTFGQDAWEILSELLGYDDERIAELAAAEALE